MLVVQPQTKLETEITKPYMLKTLVLRDRLDGFICRWWEVAVKKVY